MSKRSKVTTLDVLLEQAEALERDAKALRNALEAAGERTNARFISHAIPFINQAVERLRDEAGE